MATVSLVLEVAITQWTITQFQYYVMPVHRQAVLVIVVTTKGSACNCFCIPVCLPAYCCQYIIVTDVLKTGIMPACTLNMRVKLNSASPNYYIKCLSNIYHPS